MDTETVHVIENLSAVLMDGLAENRRHADVIAESLRDDIRMIAEGVMSLDARVVSMDTRLASVETKVESLDVKVGVLGRSLDHR
jgi:hypothetical protein